MKSDLALGDFLVPLCLGGKKDPSDNAGYRINKMNDVIFLGDFFVPWCLGGNKDPIVNAG